MLPLHNLGGAGTAERSGYGQALGFEAEEDQPDEAKGVPGSAGRGPQEPLPVPS